MIEKIAYFLYRVGRKGILLILVCVVFSTYTIFFGGENSADSEIYFLDVGQGDSELIILENNIKILIDGGPPNGKALKELDNIISANDRYIDIVLLSHPELDHFGGFVEILRGYEVGIFLWNGLDVDTVVFKTLRDILKENDVREMVVLAGDKIYYSKNTLSVLSPQNITAGDENLNDTSLVVSFRGAGGSVLFTGDISEKVEKSMHFFGTSIDVLKIPHHGSKHSSSLGFLSAIHPKISVIEVGKNSYGHPSPDVIQRIKRAGGGVYRTDRDGTIRLSFEKNGIFVYLRK